MIVKLAYTIKNEGAERDIEGIGQDMLTFVASAKDRDKGKGIWEGGGGREEPLLYLFFPSPLSACYMLAT